MENFRITGTGSVVPINIKKNDTFLNHTFLDTEGVAIPSENEVIIEKFNAITGIEQRKYIGKDQKSSDIALEAAIIAIADAQIDKETLNYIIVAHNVGDINSETNQVDTLPSLASKVKAGLKIKNPNCVAYDILFGCPGWVEGIIQSTAFIKAGMAKKCLVIGSDTLSRVLDHSDRDSMIYADGAGATILEATQKSGGILSHKTVSYTAEGESEYIFYGTSNTQKGNTKYIKMHGRKVYEFALKNVPLALKACYEESGLPIEKLKKIFIHQANKKMDDAIIKRFYRMYKTPMPKDVLPMNIETYGNSSVATVPTLFDLVLKTQYKGHVLSPGDIIMFASVGAGMNINAITYQV